MLQRTVAPENVCNIWRTGKPVCIIYVGAFINPARGFYMVLSKRFSPVQADSFRKGKPGFYFTRRWNGDVTVSIRNPAHASVILSHTTCPTNWDFPPLSRSSHYNSEAFCKPWIPPVLSVNRAYLCHTLLMSSFIDWEYFFSPDRVGIFILSSCVCTCLIDDLLDRFKENNIE